MKYLALLLLGLFAFAPSASAASPTEDAALEVAKIVGDSAAGLHRRAVVARVKVRNVRAVRVQRQVIVNRAVVRNVVAVDHVAAVAVEPLAVSVVTPFVPTVALRAAVGFHAGCGVAPVAPVVEPTPSNDVLNERRALRAEVAGLKAAMPK